MLSLVVCHTTINNQHRRDRWKRENSLDWKISICTLTLWQRLHGRRELERSSSLPLAPPLPKKAGWGWRGRLCPERHISPCLLSFSAQLCPAGMLAEQGECKRELNCLFCIIFHAGSLSLGWLCSRHKTIFTVLSLAFVKASAYFGFWHRSEKSVPLLHLRFPLSRGTGQGWFFWFLCVSVPSKTYVRITDNCITWGRSISYL